MERQFMNKIVTAINTIKFLYTEADGEDESILKPLMDASISLASSLKLEYEIDDECIDCWKMVTDKMMEKINRNLRKKFGGIAVD